MYKAVIFDLDDTIFDYNYTNEISLVTLFNTISEDFNIDYQTIKSYYENITKKLNKTNNCAVKHNKLIYFKILFEKLNIPIKFLLKYNKIYEAHFLKSLQIFEGFIELVKYLKTKNIIIGILSNNILFQQLKKLKELEIIDYIDYIYTCDECGEEKPHNNMFLGIIEKMKINKDNIIYIGDSYVNDIEPCINLGIKYFHFNNNFNVIMKEICNII